MKLQVTKLTHRNLLHFYILTMKDQKDKETISLTITRKSIKYLEINIPKETKYLDSENYKILRKETEEGTNRWRGIK